MEQGLDRLVEMLPHAEPLSYVPTFPVFSKDVLDERAFDPELAALSNQERLDYFNILAEGGLESDDVKLSGISVVAPPQPPRSAPPTSMPNISAQRMPKLQLFYPLRA